ncbi:programmed cell death protein 2-like [Mizuhopecten yessoensis]|uniref:Programmed cell death protein 2 n=1 Tax=Mizuhopecten yessoensis TaxID=6573 RepID=A0A210QEY5_MIZYE|nr:programmed cell death protein 2-like [Mizuhopecten yessoensis]OWF47269.1 Programmed cell death protein 2 [Mizuhopecten yessoensis]
MATKGGNENVELGFLEETNPDLLRSQYFPSKVGGKPSWLSLKQLPTDTHCKSCDKPTIFLMQVYSPDDKVSSAFHRTLFVFVCRDPGCSTRNSNLSFLVFRSQQPRKNDFYSQDPPSEDVPTPGPVPDTDLCYVCGSVGPKRCAKCHAVSYCSKEHQVIDWKSGHKAACSTKEETVRTDVKGVLFPEFEIITETEDLDGVDSDDESDTKGEKEKWEEYQDFLKSDKAGNLIPDSVPKSELEKMATVENLDDKIFRKFKERIKTNPDQVLRYNKGGQPLLVSVNHIPKETDIPACSCGAKRIFEFQVMPQLLSHLQVDQLSDSLDWGTLCVYTCSNSCEIGNSYQPEFLWKQDYSTDQK